MCGRFQSTDTLAGIDTCGARVDMDLLIPGEPLSLSLAWPWDHFESVMLSTFPDKLRWAMGKGNKIIVTTKGEIGTGHWNGVLSFEFS